MSLFYSHLSDPPAEALRLAQRDMIHGRTFSDPRYWSRYLVSAKGIFAAGPNPGPNRPTEDQPSVAAAADVIQSSLLTPRCFHILSHNDPQGPQLRYHYDTKVRIGGTIRRIQSSPTQAIFDLSAFGNDVEVRAHTGRVLGSDRDILASERKWLVQAVIEKHEGFSSITFRFGPNHQLPEENRTIVVKGKANLFPSLDLPNALPPLGPDISVTDSYAVKGPSMRSAVVPPSPDVASNQAALSVFAVRAAETMGNASSGPPITADTRVNEHYSVFPEVRELERLSDSTYSLAANAASAARECIRHITLCSTRPV